MYKHTELYSDAPPTQPVHGACVSLNTVVAAVLVNMF